MILEILLYLRLTYAWFNEFREVYATYQADGSIVPYFQVALHRSHRSRRYTDVTQTLHAQLGRAPLPRGA